MSENEKKKKKSDRTKYLLRSVLSVDVDLIHSVHLADRIKKNTKEWLNYMKKNGGLILLPYEIIRIGKEKIKKETS